MSKIEIEVTDDNEFNDGWLRYLVGMDRPSAEAGQNGWDMGKETATLAPVRHVFTRQALIEKPQYVVREVVPDKTMTQRFPKVTKEEE